MKKLFTIMILLVIVGCANQLPTTTNMAVVGKTYPQHECPVQIFWENEWPKDSDYEKIGYVSVQCGNDTNCNWAYVFALMQRRAAKYGANAILIKATEKDAYSHAEAGSFGMITSSGGSSGDSSGGSYKGESAMLKGSFALAVRLKKTSPLLPPPATPDNNANEISKSSSWWPIKIGSNAPPEPCP